jgi:hypothetical protein
VVVCNDVTEWALTDLAMVHLRPCTARSCPLNSGLACFLAASEKCLLAQERLLLGGCCPQAILDNSSSPYAQHMAATNLLKLATEHTIR